MGVEDTREGVERVQMSVVGEDMGESDRAQQVIGARHSLQVRKPYVYHESIRAIIPLSIPRTALEEQFRGPTMPSFLAQ